MAELDATKEGPLHSLEATHGGHSTVSRVVVESNYVDPVHGVLVGGYTPRSGIGACGSEERMGVLSQCVMAL